MITYQQYLQSPEWKRLADEAKERAGWRCQPCNREGDRSTLHAHHRCYDRKGKPGELLDVICLCEECHTLFHGHNQDKAAKDLAFFQESVSKVIKSLRSCENLDNQTDEEFSTNYRVRDYMSDCLMCAGNTMIRLFQKQFNRAVEVGLTK